MKVTFKHAVAPIFLLLSLALSAPSAAKPLFWVGDKGELTTILESHQSFHRRGHVEITTIRSSSIALEKMIMKQQ
jgi:hypothetical protein